MVLTEDAHKSMMGLTEATNNIADYDRTPVPKWIPAEQVAMIEMLQKILIQLEEINRKTR